MSNDTMEDTETICADTVDVTAKYKINSNAPTPPFPNIAFNTYGKTNPESISYWVILRG